MTPWVSRIVSALLALALLLGALLALVEINASALGRSPLLVPWPDWADWLRNHHWNQAIVQAVLIGFVVLGLLLLLLAFRRGRPSTLGLQGDSPGVTLTASRRSVERSLADAALRTTGVSGASAKVGRGTARIEARTPTRAEEGNVRTEVESAVEARMASLSLARPTRSRIKLSAKDS